MKDIYKIFALGAITLSPLATFAGGDVPNGTFATTTETKINVDVDKDTDEVILTKSDTVPDVITRAFTLKYADPYEVRPYITNACGATMYDGTETRVEAARYDGSEGGVLVVSAEDYRFEKQEDGSLSIPEIIEKLDKPGFTSSSGQPKWVYYCKYRSPEEIREVTNILFNSVNGSKNLKAGKDKTAVDTEINAVIFFAIPANMDKMKALIEEYDVPFDDINVTVQVYEFDKENDESIGTDYQTWANEIGKNMLTYDTGAGAKYFNFNPSWSTDYLDFLVSKGKGKVSTSLHATLPDLVEHSISDNTSDFIGYFNLGSYITYTSTDPSNGVSGNKTTPYTYKDENGNGNTIQQALTKTIKTQHYGLEIGIESTAYGKVNQLVYKIQNTNLIGFNSDGTPRTSVSSKTGDIMIGGEARKFVIGGVEKKSVVKVVNKLPFLGSLPYIGYLFTSEDEIEKTSQIVTVITLEFEGLNKGMDNDKINKAIESVNTAKAKLGFDQYILDENKSFSKDVDEAHDNIKAGFDKLVK